MTQYINKAALAANIDARYNECLQRAKIIDAEYWNGKADAYRDMLVILDTFEVKEEPVSEDLEKAAKIYCVNARKGYPRVMDETDRYICNAFMAGAKWQKWE